MVHLNSAALGCRVRFLCSTSLLVFVIVMKQTALNLDPVGGLHVRSKIERVDVEAIALPDLVFDAVGDPYS